MFWGDSCYRKKKISIITIHFCEIHFEMSSFSFLHRVYHCYSYVNYPSPLLLFLATYPGHDSHYDLLRCTQHSTVLMLQLWMGNLGWSRIFPCCMQVVIKATGDFLHWILPWLPKVPLPNFIKIQSVQCFSVQGIKSPWEQLFVKWWAFVVL